MKKEWSYRAKSIQDCSTAIKSQHWFFLHIYREMHIHTMPCCRSLVRNPAWLMWLSNQSGAWNRHKLSHGTAALNYVTGINTSHKQCSECTSTWGQQLQTHTDHKAWYARWVISLIMSPCIQNLHRLKSFRLFQYFLSPIKETRELQEFVLEQDSLQERVGVFW